MRNIYLLFFILAYPPVLAQDYDLTKSMAYLQTFERIDAPTLAEFIQKNAPEKRVFGLGEASHYMRECYQFKQKIISELMNLGYQGLVLEVDFGLACRWNEYVLTGKGNLDSLLANTGWFTYGTEEFKQLLLEIREFNQNNSQQPFQVFGMEMTYSEHLLVYLRDYLQEHSRHTPEVLPLLEKSRLTLVFQPFTAEQRADYWLLFHQLSSFLQTYREELVTSSGEKPFMIAQRMVEIIRQFATFVSQDEFSLQVEFRDQFSFRNLLWAMDYLGDNSQIALWAHNGHVAKRSILFQYDILGHYLEQRFGLAYFTMGFTFNQGEFGAHSQNGFKTWTMPAALQPSWTKSLSKLMSPYIVWDIRSQVSRGGEAFKVLDQMARIRTDVAEFYNPEGGEFMRINLAKTYDALLFIEKSHYPTTLK